jgi:RNA polymerase sigma-70 factor (ECF subfamily)
LGPIEATAVEIREFDYDSLVRPLESRMMRSIWRIVRQREAAEDALQDALAVVWKKRDRVARHPNPGALILRIAVAAAHDAVRKSRRRIGREIPGLPLPDGRADDSTASVMKAAEDRSLRAEILEAIARLPKRQATAVLLRVVEEQSYEDVARAMGCAETTARVHALRGKAALARHLERLRPGYIAAAGRAGKEFVS